MSTGAACGSSVVHVVNALAALPRARAPTTAFSFLNLAFIIGARGLPAPLARSLAPFAALVVGTCANAGWRLYARAGIAELGAVPAGLPRPAAPAFGAVRGHAADVAVVSFVMLTETLAMGKVSELMRGW